MGTTDAHPKYPTLLTGDRKPKVNVVTIANSETASGRVIPRPPAVFVPQSVASIATMAALTDEETSVAQPDPLEDDERTAV